MKRKHKGHDEGHADESWLLPYSDMMTLLLALFIVMFASSSVDEQKFNAIMESMYEAFGGTVEVGNPIDIGVVGEQSGGDGAEELTFDDLFEALLKAVEQSQYRDNIEVVANDGSIVVQFNDSVLFMPDSSTMTVTGHEVLLTIGSIFIDLNQLIGHIEIEGHTAFIGEEADATAEAWRLSSDRAIAVLEYFAFELGYGQEKLHIAGYSHFVPVATNDTEEGRAKNRRVELLITPSDGYVANIKSAISLGAATAGINAATAATPAAATPAAAP
jgi:chemotaxis protein MotB